MLENLFIAYGCLVCFFSIIGIIYGHEKLKQHSVFNQIVFFVSSPILVALTIAAMIKHKIKK